MAPADTVEARIQELFARGDTLLGEDRFAQAIALYQQALELIPEPVKAHRLAAHAHANLGDAYLLLKRYEEARRAFQDAVESKQGAGNAYVQLRLGQCAYELGDLGQAEEHLAHAHALKGEEIFEGEEEKYLRFIRALDSTRRGP